MRPGIVSTIAARELRDAVRGRWFALSAIGFGALSFGIALLGLAGAQRAGLGGYDRVTASLANLVLVFVPLVGLVLGALGLAGDLEDGALGALLAQPVSRAEVFLGKYLGATTALSAAAFAGFGTTGAIVGLATGGGRAGAFALLVLLVVLLAAASLAIGTMLSAALGARAKAVGAAFAAWLALVYVSDLGAIGLTLARSLRPAQVFALALLNPVEQARVLVTLALTERLDMLGPVGLFGLDTFGARGLVAVLVGALLMTSAVMLGAGYSVFRKAVVT